MIANVIIKKIKKFKDERGWLAEFYRSDEIDYQPVMSYVSITQPGVRRGPHEHVSQTDFFVFVGPGDFELHLWDRSLGKARDRQEKSKTKEEYMKIKVGEKNPCLVIVPPGVVHGYKCVSDTPAYCINLPDKLYKGEGKQDEVDEIRWEDDPDSPYIIK